MSDVSTISSAMSLIAFSRERSSRIPSTTDLSRASGCGRRVSLKRRTSAAWLASRKMSTGLRRGILRSCLNTLGNDDRNPFSRTSTTIATLSMPRVPRRDSFASVGMSVVGRLSTQK